MIALIRSLILISAIALSACTTGHLSSDNLSPGNLSELTQGKRDFIAGFYKRAIRHLLPLACDGNAEAQYAMGYLYYYGYGVAQDTDVGYFWIHRSAMQHYRPAVQALELIEK